VVTASLLAPLTVIPMAILISIGTSVLDGGGSAAGGFADMAGDLFSVTLFYSLFGLAVAYPAVWLLGVPGYFIARWLGWVNYPAAILVAVLACIPLSVVDYKGHGLPGIFLLLVVHAVPIACVFVKIVKPKGDAAMTAGNA
jgi:hypothetical protein